MSSVLIHAERRVSRAITRIQTRSERCLFYFLSQFLYLSLFLSLSVSLPPIEIARDRLVLRFSLDFFGVTAALGRGPCSLIEGSIERKMRRAERAGGEWLASRCVAETTLKQRVNAALYSS